jgi:hypothetical protein
MLTAGLRSCPVFLVLAVYLIVGSPSYSQSSTNIDGFAGPKLAGNRTSSGAWLAKCTAVSTPTLAGRFFGDEAEWLIGPHSTPSDSNFAAATNLPCVERPLSTGPRAVIQVEDPCRDGAWELSGAPPVSGCNVSEDIVPVELASLGKPGVKIARARQEILKILRSGNTCAEWYKTKDRNAAETFQSVNYLLDPHGEQDIFASIEVPSTLVMRQPYVAQATQDGGAHTTITINVNGAFYRAQGRVQKAAHEGGPVQSGGSHLLTVGSYAGDTLPAQMVTLLHEFGHIINLLPEDADSLDSKSMRNTDEVLRHCRAEVLARAKQAR